LDWKEGRGHEDGIERKMEAVENRVGRRIEVVGYLLILKHK
jgi:hypothetical protein